MKLLVLIFGKTISISLGAFWPGALVWGMKGTRNPKPLSGVSEAGLHVEKWLFIQVI